MHPRRYASFTELQPTRLDLIRHRLEAGNITRFREPKDVDALIYSYDQYGIKNYRLSFMSLLALTILYSAIAGLAPLLLWCELRVDGANIHTYRDAFWTLQMSASTIGFGDFYPLSAGGRVIVAMMFYLGIGLVGFIGALIAERLLGFAKTDIKNRELREQNVTLLAHNRELERKLDHLLERLEAKVLKD